MVKQSSKNLIELGDQVTHSMHPEIFGIVSTITRNRDTPLKIGIEQWSEETKEMIFSTVYANDLKGENDELFSNNAEDYEDYFPKDEDGEFKFKLYEEYADIHTKLEGFAIDHTVCITGCDRTNLQFVKGDKGLYIMGSDLLRIKLTSGIDAETADSTVNEDRRAVGAPNEMSQATL